VIVIAGAGMAGLVAAVRLRELGHDDVVVREKGTRIGGSMLLSSGVVWRHRNWDDFRSECPGGDERLQRVVWERFDEALIWLESLGAPVVWQETGNPRTTGRRFDPKSLTETLAARAGTIELRAEGCTADTTILCTGGFSASSDLVTRYIRPAASLRLRANPWSEGDGLCFALDRGAALSSGMDEFYGRNMPDAPWDETQLVSLSQLYGRFARVFDEDGIEFFKRDDVSWSETNVVQATARRRDAKAYYVLDDLPFDPPAGTVAAVRVIASITHTIGGLRVDERAHVLRDDGSELDGLYAAGIDAGGVATGGYSSGLAQALVLGLAAAEDAAR
jgi:succinate dehydrogenase/fumarate reductase flavoprotein subunit